MIHGLVKLLNFNMDIFILKFSQTEDSTETRLFVTTDKLNSPLKVSAVTSEITCFNVLIVAQDFVGRLFLFFIKTG